MWFGFLVRSQQLLDCFLTKKTLTTKDIKESHPCFVSQTSANLQSAKPCQVERGQLKEGERGNNYTESEGWVPTSSLFSFLSPDWSKQWLIIPFSALWRISIFYSMLLCAQYKDGWIILILMSSHLWAARQEVMKSPCCPMYHFKWFSLFQVTVQLFRFLSLQCGFWACRGLCELVKERDSGASDPYMCSLLDPTGSEWFLCLLPLWCNGMLIAFEASSHTSAQSSLQASLYQPPGSLNTF